MKRPTLILLGVRVLGSLAQAVILISLARNIEPSAFGLLNAVFGVSMVIASVADLGTVTSIGRTQISNPELATRSIRLGSISLIIACIPSVAILLLYIHEFSLAVIIGSTLLVIGALLDRISELGVTRDLASSRLEPVVYSVLLRRGISVAIYLGLVSASADHIVSYGLSIFAAGVTGSAIFFWRQAGDRSIDRESNFKVGTLFPSSFAFMVANVAAQARSLDAVIVYTFAGPVAGGLYSGASRLVQPFTLLAGALSAVVLPDVARKGRHLARKRVAQIWLSSALATIIVAPIALNSGTILVILLGSAYEEAGTILAVLLVGFPVVVLSSPLGAILQACGFEKFVAINGAISGAHLVIFIAVGSYFLGGFGAALGFSISYILKFVSLSVFYSQRKLT